MCSMYYALAVGRSVRLINRANKTNERGLRHRHSFWRNARTAGSVPVPDRGGPGTQKRFPSAGTLRVRTSDACPAKRELGRMEIETASGRERETRPRLLHPAERNLLQQVGMRCPYERTPSGFSLLFVVFESSGAPFSRAPSATNKSENRVLCIVHRQPPLSPVVGTFVGAAPRHTQNVLCTLAAAPHMPRRRGTSMRNGSYSYFIVTAGLHGCAERRSDTRTGKTVVLPKKPNGHTVLSCPEAAGSRGSANCARFSTRKFTMHSGRARCQNV